MSTAHLETKFARIGARLKVADAPDRRRRVAVIGPVALDVRDDRKGEFCEIIRRPGADAEVEVAEDGGRHGFEHAGMGAARPGTHEDAGRGVEGRGGRHGGMVTGNGERGTGNGNGCGCGPGVARGLYCIPVRRDHNDTGRNSNPFP